MGLKGLAERGTRCDLHTGRNPAHHRAHRTEIQSVCCLPVRFLRARHCQGGQRSGSAGGYHWSPDSRFFELAALHLDLEEALQKRVDLITLRSIQQKARMPSQESFQKAVLEEMVKLYENFGR